MSPSHKPTRFSLPARRLLRSPWWHAAFAASLLSFAPGFAAESTEESKKPEVTKEAPATIPAKDSATNAPEAVITSGSVTNTSGSISTNAPVNKDEASTAKEDSSATSRRDDRNRDRRRRDRSSSGSETNAPANKGTDFASFKIITDRNIFSPSRTTPSSAKAEAPRQPKVDTFSLVGTLSYSKGDFAFFEGSSSEYRKALKPADSIAGYKVVSVGENEVVLESGDKKITLKMGGQFRRVDDGPWEQRTSPLASSDTSSKPSETGTSDSSSGAGGSEDEILQRLLKKREQEMNNEKR